MSGLLEAAVKNGLISAPHFPYLPDKFPVIIASAAVRLIEGCEPPLGGRARVGSGTGRTRDAAAMKALYEAAERYSLQYDVTRPDMFVPSETIGGPAEGLSTASLSLGAPGGGARSIGAAAGKSFDDAVGRAALELLEHFELGRLGSDAVSAEAFDPATIPDLAVTVDYLSKRLRHLKIEAVAAPSGYAVVRAVCCDSDGGRPTEGSAASLSIEAAAVKAVEEAIFSWRNMIELERNGVPPAVGAPDILLRTYRGAEALSHPIPQAALGKAPPHMERTQKRPVEILASVTGTRVRVFDMTAPALGIHVARVVLD